MNACPKCPFREVGGLPYTDDGHAALEDGHQPSCHLHTEHGRQFDDPMPSAEIECKGYHLYMACKPGFAIPKREPATQHRAKFDAWEAAQRQADTPDDDDDGQYTHQDLQAFFTEAKFLAYLQGVADTQDGSKLIQAGGCMSAHLATPDIQ